MDIEKLFTRAKSVQPTQSYKTVAKSRLLERIASKNTEKRITHTAKNTEWNSIEPSNDYKIITWQRLVSRMKQAQDSLLVRCYKIFKRAIATTLACCLLFFTVFSFELTAPTNVIEASSETHLVILEGGVEVKSLGGDWEKAHSHQPLRLLDMIRTSDNTEAEIHFFNSTVTRLSPNTEVIIKELKVHPRIQRTGVVNLYLEEGQIWARALQVKDRYSKMVVETKDGKVSTSHATFSVSTSDSEGSEIASYDRVVDVDVATDTKQLNEGYVVKLKNNGIIQKKIEDSHNDIQKNWVDQNLERDIAFDQKLAEETVKVAEAEAGILPTSPLYQAKIVGEKTQEILPLENTKRGYLLLQLAKKRLNESASLLSSNQVDLAEEVLADFSVIVQDLAEIAKSDETLYAEVLAALKEKEQKFLAFNKTNSVLYRVKETIRDARESVVASEVEKKTVQLEIANESLHELADIIEREHPEFVQSELEKIQSIVKSLKENKEEMVHTEQLALAKEALPVLDQLVEKVALKKEAGDIHSEVLTAKDLQEAREYIAEIIHNDPAKKQVAVFTVNETPGGIVSKEPNIEGEQDAIKQYAYEKLQEQRVLLQTQQRRDDYKIDAKVTDFVNRIGIYRTIHSKQTQLKILLSRTGNTQEDLEFLYRLRNKVDIQLRHLVNEKIFKIEQSL